MKLTSLLTRPLLCAALVSASGSFAAEISANKPKTAKVDPKTRQEYDDAGSQRIANFRLPAGIKAKLTVDESQTQNPCAITFDQHGRLYIAETHRWRAGVEDIRNQQRLIHVDIANVTSEDRLKMYQNDPSVPLSYYQEFEDRIIVLEDTDKDGRMDTSKPWADGFNDVLDGPGIGIVSTADGSMYYTNIPHLWKLNDEDGDGKAEKRESIQDGFGVRMSYSGHDMHGVVQGPDGKIYWSIGDRGYTFTTREGLKVERPMEGGVFRCDPDGSNVEEYYRGLRNPQELAFDKFGNLFTCDNQCDFWDKARLVYILEGGDSGWNHGHQALLNFREQYKLRTPEYNHPGRKRIPMSPWLTEGMWEANNPRRPDFVLPPVGAVSWGPSGLVYNYGVTSMPERYADHFWVCNFGGVNGDLEAFSVETNGAHFKVKRHETFMVGLGNTDVEFGPDGKMYLCCFNNSGWFKEDVGNVYTLFQENPRNADLLKATEGLLTSPLTGAAPEKLAGLLSHPDMRVRQRAQFALVEQKRKDLLLNAAQVDGGAAPEFASKESHNLLRRLHGIWGIAQLAKEDPALWSSLLPLLGDEAIEIRASTARALGESRTAEAGRALIGSLQDASPRVQSFAAIGVGKCKQLSAYPKLMDVLISNADADHHLRHACVQALWELGPNEKLRSWAHHENASVRMASLLVHRKFEDPGIATFLGDESERIRFSAIRAINDLNLEEAVPALARHITNYTTRKEGFRLPEGEKDWIIHHRLINANFRLGTEEAALRLVAYAKATHLPEILRIQALDALAEWSKPTAVDATVGFHRPLDPASRAVLGASVGEHYRGLFENASGELLAKAIDTAVAINAGIPNQVLLGAVQNAKAPTSNRVSSLRALANKQPDQLAPFWDALVADANPEVRNAAMSELLKLDEGRGVAAALQLAASTEVVDRQNVYAALAHVQTKEVGELFASRLKNLSDELPGARFELLEFAVSRPEPEVKKALTDYQASLPADDVLSPFLTCQEGGDIESGKKIFLVHAAGQCSKCHRVSGDGGVVGPDLTDIGGRYDNHKLLESLINPSAVVGPGYGITMIGTKDGKTIGGAFVREDEQNVYLKLPDPENPSEFVESPISKEAIATRQPPISAMPSMAAMLTKREIRDVLAYLASLDPTGQRRK